MSTFDGILFGVAGTIILGTIIFASVTSNLFEIEDVAEAVCSSHNLKLLQVNESGIVVCFDGAYSSQKGFRLFDLESKGGN